MSKHRECRYCDTGFRHVEIDGDFVCEGCGAEWDPIWVDDEEEDKEYEDEE